MKLLVIEDEKELLESIVAYLKNENYVSEVAGNFEEAREKIETSEYDCIVLDITLPGGSGLQLLQELKNSKKTEGIIIISAKNSIDDKITGLKLGADDYLVKPFHLSELTARINAIIRRKKFDGNNTISFNEIAIDTLSKEVKAGGELIELTPKEYALLVYFISNQRKVISINALFSHLWKEEMGAANNSDLVYTHIRNLRKKLQEKGCADYIKSLYGMGYKLSDS